VTGLWDSFADDAFVRDVDSEDCISIPENACAQSQGEIILSVRGPLNIARPVQGCRSFVQAGASEDGKQLAGNREARVHRWRQGLADGQKLYADIQGPLDRSPQSRAPQNPARRLRRGRRTASRKRRGKRAKLDSMVHYDRRHLPRSRSKLGTMLRLSIPDGQVAAYSRDQCEQKAAASAWVGWCGGL